VLISRSPFTLVLVQLTLSAPHGVEAPRPRAGGREIQKHEAEQHGGVPLIEHRPEALGCVPKEISEGHLAGKQKGHRTRVNSPSSRNNPPNVSRKPAIHACEPKGAVPPPGMMGAGNPNNLAVPNCMKRKAATIRSTLSRYGAQERHFVTMFGAAMMGPHLSMSTAMVRHFPWLKRRTLSPQRVA
jgi:hypothetical protein